MQVLHVISFEWDRTVKHSEQYDTCTPKISFEPFVTFVPNDFWGDVGGCSTLLKHRLSMFHLLTYTKICNFDITLPVE